jgi:hypothetical protein
VIAQDPNISNIEQVLSTQEHAWNKGDLTTFMDTYWKHDNLQFLNKDGLIYGWSSTFDRYTTTYPDIRAMGQLTFQILNISKRSKKVYSVVGKYHLERKPDNNIDGHFLLVVQKIRGQWKIVADSTH